MTLIDVPSADRPRPDYHNAVYRGGVRPATPGWRIPGFSLSDRDADYGGKSAIRRGFAMREPAGRSTLSRCVSNLGAVMLIAGTGCAPGLRGYLGGLRRDMLA